MGISATWTDEIFRHDLNAVILHYLVRNPFKMAVLLWSVLTAAQECCALSRRIKERV